MTFEAGTGAYVIDVLSITAAPPALVTEDKGRRVVALALVVVSPAVAKGSMQEKRVIPLTEDLIGTELLGLEVDAVCDGVRFSAEG